VLVNGKAVIGRQFFQAAYGSKGWHGSAVLRLQQSWV